MKKNKKLIPWQILMVACIACLFSACSKDTVNTKKTHTYTIYNPVYKAKATVLAAINGSSNQSIEHAGKI